MAKSNFKPTKILKTSGETVMFDPSKLRRSLERSGASEFVIQQVIDEVEKLLYNGISTREIYKKAFALLRKSSRPSAARYKLKKAIYELGPSGFPFERLVSAILQYEGFQTIVDVIEKGHCVSHEVDVVAEKSDTYYMVECKFHRDQGHFCDVKVPLYIHSRFMDIEKERKKLPKHDKKFHQGCIFTNTRFTAEAVQYGICAGLMLVGWNHPKKGSLKERIDEAGLHPITCLTTLSNYEKKLLLEKGKVLCIELCNEPQLLKSIGINEQRHQNILNETRELCKV